MKVILIGAGTMARAHASAYMQMADVQLSAVVDQRLQVAAKLADEVPAKAYSSLEEAVAGVDCDVIDICVPTPFHKAYILQAARWKKHVISEKPLCLTLSDARAAIDACDNAGVQLFVGQVVRFFPEYREIHRLLCDQAVGQVGTARTFRGGQFPGGWNDWYANTRMSGTLMVDLMIHDFDFLRWCFGDVERVFAQNLAEHELNRMDHVYASLRFKNGVIAHVEGSWAMPSGFGTEIEIAGKDGLLQYKSSESAPVRLVKRSEVTGSASVPVPESPLEHSPYYTELRHFMDCLQDKREPIVTPEDAYRALEISLAAVESSKSGQPVYLDVRKEVTGA